MNSTELLELFRKQVTDEAVPYLWSDEEVWEYMTDAQRMYCRLVEGILDSSSALTQIPVTAGEPWIELSPLILKIRRAQIVLPLYKDLKVINQEDITTQGLVQEERLTGEPAYLVLGMEQSRAKLIRIPTTDNTVEISVFRLPLDDITGEEQDLEIPAESHRHLLHWMKALAYQKQDADTFDRGRSEEFEARFRAYCVQAQREAHTRRHKPRLIAYGGL